ncbi:MAG TPA: hypothetical protein VI844_03790, partial [Coxiellaceae bacterium]|nr:hypothetical protein [Coxiellaceae bacterium]
MLKKSLYISLGIVCLVATNMIFADTISYKMTAAGEITSCTSTIPSGCANATPKMSRTIDSFDNVANTLTFPASKLLPSIVMHFNGNAADATFCLVASSYNSPYALQPTTLNCVVPNNFQLITYSGNYTPGNGLIAINETAVMNMNIGTNIGVNVTIDGIKFAPTTN